MFIVIDGPDGSGKTTQIMLLKDYLEGQGYEVEITREPGGTPYSEKIRTLVRDDTEITSRKLTELYAMLSARTEHVLEFINPELKAGKIIICDRFEASTWAYQAYPLGMTIGQLKKLSEPIWSQLRESPLELILLTDPVTTSERLKKRRIKPDKLDVVDKKDITEITKAYGIWATSVNNRYTSIIDASGSVGDVHKNILDTLKDRLPNGH